MFGDDSRPGPFHEATKKLLEAPASPSAGERGIPFGLDSVARLAALKRTGAFDVVENRTSRWSLVLDADQSVALYATYSNVTARLDREAVLAEIGRIARDVFILLRAECLQGVSRVYWARAGMMVCSVRRRPAAMAARPARVR